MNPITTAAIVIIGNEILSGKFAEENAAYLIPALRELGVQLARIEIIADVVADIAETVKRCGERCNHVFTSGGVGPTHDDVTMQGIAHAFGVSVCVHPHLEQLVRAYWGEKLEPRHLRLADVPEGAQLVDMGSQVWPVTQFRNIYILPGVPSIFRRKFDAMRERFRSTPFVTRRVYSTLDESHLAPHLDAVVAAHPDVSIGSYPRFEEKDFRVLVTLEAQDAALVTAAMRDLLARLPKNAVVKQE